MHLGILPADNIGPLVAVIACGICLGFLPFNFHPAKIFMGDAGALFLGLLMSASTMVIGGRRPAPSGVATSGGQTYFFFAPLFIPFFILGVPLFDMAFAFVRRTANRTGFSHPGQEPPPPPAAPARPRPPPQRAHPVGLDGAAVRASSSSRSSSPGQRRHPLRRAGPGRGALHLLPPRAPPAGDRTSTPDPGAGGPAPGEAATGPSRRPRAALAPGRQRWRSARRRAPPRRGPVADRPGRTGPLIGGPAAGRPAGAARGRFCRAGRARVR